MTLYYLPGFSTVGSAQSMTATVAGSVATVASASYAHATLASVMGTGNFTALSAAVKTAFDSATASTFTVTWSSSTYLYTISRAATFTLAFSTAADLRLRAALGFTGNKSGANTYTSDVRPYYVIVPRMGARTGFTDVYEPDDIVEEAVSDGGTSTGVARRTSELLCEWSQAMEEIDGPPSGSELGAAVFEYTAPAAYPWSWQHFFRHVRGQYPIGVYESGVSNRVYKLRADGASFDPERFVSDYDGLWSVPIRARDLGAIT
jgi:hypothetical protein